MKTLIRSAALAAGVVIGGVRGLARGMRDPVAAAGTTTSPDPLNAVARLGWKSWALILLLLGSIAGVGGMLVVISGVMPIKASSGHWPITEWFLHYSMQRSIATHSAGMHTPPLEDAALVLKGAGHYDYGCRPCHGSPALRQPKVAAAMTPHPPYLPPRIPQWKARELFYVVKHGVKFTGMPAWPSLRRDDEVWAMVAFLQVFPRLNVQEYDRLAGTLTNPGTEAAPVEALTEPNDVPSIVTASCGRCHGVEGLGRGTGAFPKLAGQRPEYLYASLQAYARGERHSGIMQPLAAGMEEPQMRDVALYYARRAARAPEHGTGNLALGSAIANGGIPDRRIPACVNCHGPSDVERNPVYPLLAGQYSRYLLLQLELFRNGHRGGTQYAHIMGEVMKWLNPEEMRAVAAYYGSLR